MSIHIGGTEIKDIKIGSTAINSVWIGSNKVWTRYLDEQTVTVGVATSAGMSFTGSWEYHFRGYSSSISGSSISDGTSNIYNNDIEHLYYVDASGTSYNTPYAYEKVYFIVAGNHSNSGWTTMSVAGTDFARSAATHVYFSFSDTTEWAWDVTSNPFGTTTGATKTVTWL